MLKEGTGREDGIWEDRVVTAVTRRFSKSVAAAGDVAQEVWRWVSLCDAMLLSWEKSVLMRSMTNSAGLVYSGIYRQSC